MNLGRLIVLAGALVVIPASANAQYQDVNSSDVTLLKAWRDRYLALELHKCWGWSPDPGGTVPRDCTSHFVQETKLDGDSSPTIGRIEVQTTLQGKQLYSWQSIGHVVEIRLAVKRSLYKSPKFAGVGFYAKSLLGEGAFFFEKYKLDEIEGETVYLKSGEPAVVLRFTMFMAGYLGAWSHADSITFKPYVRMSNSWNDQSGLHLWDDAPGNYVLVRGASDQPGSIDRAHEVLWP